MNKKLPTKRDLATDMKLFDPNQKTSKGALEADSFFAAPLNSIPLNSELQYPVYVRVNDRYVLFREVDDIITPNRLEELAKKTNSCFVEKAHWIKYLEHLENKHYFSDDPLDQALGQRHLMLAYLQMAHIFPDKGVEKEDLQRIGDGGKSLANFLKVNPNEASKLIQKFSDPAMYYINHSVNILIYALMIGMKIGIAGKELESLAKSIITHNIGNLLIPSEILFKPGKLTKNEWDVMKSHTSRGAAILSSLKAPKEACLTALQHHEHHDGGGYPNALSGGEIHFFAKICAVADVYDSLTTDAPYRKAIGVEQAMKEIQGMKGKFDPQIIRVMDKQTSKK